MSVPVPLPRTRAFAIVVETEPVKMVELLKVAVEFAVTPPRKVYRPDRVRLVEVLKPMTLPPDQVMGAFAVMEAFVRPRKLLVEVVIKPESFVNWETELVVNLMVPVEEMARPRPSWNVLEAVPPIVILEVVRTAVPFCVIVPEAFNPAPKRA